VKKAFLLVAVVGMAMTVSSTASAASWRGVVVAKDQARGAVATASRGGVVRTVRTRSVARLRVGDVLSVRANERADGTFAALRVSRVARARRAQVRGTVVVHQARLGRTLLAAGGTVLAVRSRTSRAPQGVGGLAPGDVVSASVGIAGGNLRALGVREVGHEDVLKLEGIFLDLEGSVLRLAVVRRGLVVVRVPADADVPELEAGDVIQVVVSLDENGRFVLVSVREDGADKDEGVDVDEDVLNVRGTVAALSEESVSVQPGEGASRVTCRVPAEADLSGFFVGDVVELRCFFDEGRFHLARMKSKVALIEVGEEGEVDAEFALSGVLVELGAESVGVRVRDRVVRCALPEGANLAGFAVGVKVEAYCYFAEGEFHLEKLKSATAVWYAEEDAGPVGELTVEGPLVEVGSENVVVRSGERNVSCARRGAQLVGFYAGDRVLMHCHLADGGAFRLAKLMGPTALWKQEEPGDEPLAEFTLNGALASKSSSSVGVTVREQVVSCTHPNANLSPFSVGEQVELHCHLGGGAFRLEYLKSEHAKVVVEP
jgi:hypothetical protein